MPTVRYFHWASARQRFDDAVGEDQEIQGEMIDVKPFVIEDHAEVYRPLIDQSCSDSFGHGHGHGQN